LRLLGSGIVLRGPLIKSKIRKPELIAMDEMFFVTKKEKNSYFLHFGDGNYR
jgi:hypothetical protein